MMTTLAYRRRPTQHEILEQLDALFRLDGEAAGETLLIRHAQPAITSAGEEHEIDRDPMLSCEGLRQAELLAGHLSNLGIDAIFTSPARRCFQTAKIAADLLQCPLTVVDALTDIDYDPRSAEGVSGAYAERFTRDPRWEALPGFAPGAAFRRRAIAAIEGIMAAHPTGRSVVVSHTSVLNAYLGQLLGIPRDQFFAPDHASISTVRHSEQRAVLRCLNDTSHLEPCTQITSLTPALTGRSLPLTNR